MSRVRLNVLLKDTSIHTKFQRIERSKARRNKKNVFNKHSDSLFVLFNKKQLRIPILSSYFVYNVVSACSKLCFNLFKVANNDIKVVQINSSVSDNCK